MRWFDDVWTKEVFANFFAAKMTEPLFPAINHTLSALKNFYAASYSEDRTEGCNAIKQNLESVIYCQSNSLTINQAAMKIV